jgi:hypothetical protein
MKYYQTDEIQKMIDWEKIMKMNRCAGGHDDQMIGLFKDSTLIGHYNEGGYGGQVATCVQLSDGKFAIYNDYYGSCSGCDAWEDALDENIRAMCIGLSNDTYVFNNAYDVIEFLKLDNKDRYSWDLSCSDGLLQEIMKNVSIVRDVKIEGIIKNDN